MSEVLHPNHSSMLLLVILELLKAHLQIEVNLVILIIFSKPMHKYSFHPKLLFCRYNYPKNFLVGLEVFVCQ